MEVNPVKFNFTVTNKCFDSSIIYNKQRWVDRLNWISSSMIEILFFFSSNICISAIMYYWRNYTHNLCNLTAFIPKQFVSELVRPFVLFTGACS